MKKMFLILLGLLCVPSLIAGEKPVPHGAKIFIEAMDGDLDGFIKAEIIKKNVPVKVVGSVDDAAFVLTGNAVVEEKRSWHEGWLTPTKDHDTGNVQLVNKESKDLVWASEGGDRSLWWGSLKRGGVRKVADRIVNNLKDAVAKE